jgi:8-oxo-dGTP pyrophosphatase MutT (NUDIX family)
MSHEPVRAAPAATLVPLRDGRAGLEVLLLRRSERAAFVPGGYVFPGGLVEPADATAGAQVRGISAVTADDRLGLHGSDPPALAYFVAAVRETFEESGLLVGVRSDDSPAEIAAVRTDLLERRIGFVEALTRLHAHVAGDQLQYFAHWITPVGAPRRYDTRFFAARVPRDAEPALDPREMTGALWTTPGAALRAHASGTLKMILPTIATLEHLATFSDAGAALAAMAEAVVAANLPTGPTEGFAARSGEHRLARP